MFLYFEKYSDTSKASRAYIKHSITSVNSVTEHNFDDRCVQGDDRLTYSLCILQKYSSSSDCYLFNTQ